MQHAIKHRGHRCHIADEFSPKGQQKGNKENKIFDAAIRLDLLEIKGLDLNTLIGLLACADPRQTSCARPRMLAEAATKGFRRCRSEMGSRSLAF